MQRIVTVPHNSLVLPGSFLLKVVRDDGQRHQYSASLIKGMAMDVSIGRTLHLIMPDPAVMAMKTQAEIDADLIDACLDASKDIMNQS